MTKAPALGPPIDVTLITSRVHPRACISAVIPCTLAAAPVPGCAFFPTQTPLKERSIVVQARARSSFPELRSKGCSRSLRRRRGDCCEDAQARPYFNDAATAGPQTLNVTTYGKDGSHSLWWSLPTAKFTSSQAHAARSTSHSASQDGTQRTLPVLGGERPDGRRG